MEKIKIEFSNYELAVLIKIIKLIVDSQTVEPVDKEEKATINLCKLILKRLFKISLDTAFKTKKNVKIAFEYYRAYNIYTFIQIIMKSEILCELEYQTARKILGDLDQKLV